MNTHEYELIGESIWNTYKSLGKLLFETKKKSKFKEIDAEVLAAIDKANTEHAKKGQDRRDAIRAAQRETARGVAKYGYVGYYTRKDKV